MAGGFEARRRTHTVLGVLAGVAMLWCLLMAFWPVSLRNGHSCGVPALTADPPGTGTFDTDSTDCGLAESLRVHKTVGLGAVGVPLAVLWLWVGAGLRAETAEADRDRMRLLDRDADERRRAAAGGRRPGTAGAPGTRPGKMSLRELAAQDNPLPKVDD